MLCNTRPLDAACHITHIMLNSRSQAQAVCMAAAACFCQRFSFSRFAKVLFMVSSFAGQKVFHCSVFEQLWKVFRIIGVVPFF